MKEDKEEKQCLEKKEERIGKAKTVIQNPYNYIE